MSEGNKLIQAENLTWALAIFESVITTDSSFADGYAQIWYIYLLQWKLNEAMKSINASLEINADSVLGLTNMWIAESMQGNFTSATAFLDRALALDPANVQALVYQGNSIADSGRLLEAITYYDKAIAIDPEWYLTWFNKGTVLADLWYNGQDASKSNQAINHFAKVLELNPEYHLAHIYKWVSFFDQQLFDDALSAINLWLINDPNNTDGLYYKGLTLSQLERYEDAKVALSRVLELDPGHGYAKQELDRIQ